MRIEDFAPLVLTSHVQLCLAHYCDLHGPTPLMVTEGVPVPCSLCFDDLEAPSPPSPFRRPGSAAAVVDDEDDNDRPRTSAAATSVSAGQATAAAINDAFRRMNLGAPRSSSVPASEQEALTHRAAILRAAAAGHGQGHGTSAAGAAVSSGSAIENSPPDSPRRAPAPELQPSAATAGAQHARRDSSFRKTYDEYVTKRASPCENCALTLPRRQDAGGQQAKVDFKSGGRGPTLRSRAPYSRVYGLGGGGPGGAGGRAASPAQSQVSSASSSRSSMGSDDTDGDAPPDDDEEEENERRRRRQQQQHRHSAAATSRSSASSSGHPNSHTHYLDYISTHEPVGHSSFRIVRASCLRTLSFETLPRGPGSAAGGGATASGLGLGLYGPPPSASSPQLSTYPSYPLSTPQHHQLPSYVTTHSAGSSGSGGPIFFGDPSTGYTTAYIFRIPDVHARGHRRVYAFLALSTHRERLAIKTFKFVTAAFHELAGWIQMLAEAEAERAAEATSPIGAGGAFASSAFAAASLSQQDQRESAAVDRGSSFLSGGSAFTRRMGGGGGSLSLKQRGLAELVGLPDFFIELHRRFVTLLLELGVMLGS